MKRIYLDSNVFISLVREEIDSAFNLRFQDSQAFLALCEKEEIEIILSGIFFDEVRKITGLDKDSVLEFMRAFGIKLFLIEKDENTKEKAIELQKKTKLHFSDSLHTALAVKSSAEIIISWNKKDFKKVSTIIECKNPQEFIEGFS